MGYYAKRMWGGASGIIQDSSLKLWLDASNPLSYPGTGTTWYDLSGNGNNGTLVNGPTFNSGNGGSIVFDGVNDYTLITSHQFRTVDIWINYKNIGVDWKYLLDARPGAPSGWYSPLGIGGNWVTQYVNGVRTTVSFSHITINSWCNLTLISNQNYTSTINFMSRFSNTEFAGGEISQIKTYNRALTAEEVLQNFQATRNKYGI